MKETFQFADQSSAARAQRRVGFCLRWSAAIVCTVFCRQVLCASPSAGELSALPEVSIAANYLTALTNAAIPSSDSFTLRSQAAISLIEAGFLIGTTTAVHELGHARRVRVAGGHSKWETGDVNWWSYFTHRDPLAAGATQWELPDTTNLDENIAILAGGFNATTSWDESVAGKGLYRLVTARYSMLFYEFSGVSAKDDDLAQLVTLYNMKGYSISRREMQCWQLLAGCISETFGSVKTYAYLTPRGVSVRAVTYWDDWLIATEAVVHGAPAVEGEVGRKFYLGSNIEVLPKVLVSAHGLGGSLKADVRFRQAVLSLNGQFVNTSTLLGTRATTSIDLEVALRL